MLYITQISLQNGGEINFPRRTSSSCSTSGTCRVTLVTGKCAVMYVC